MPARVLLYSQRNLYEQEVWRAPYWEFEQTLEQIETMDVLAPRPGRFFRQRRNHAMRMGKVSALVVNPGLPPVRLAGEYDLFFAVCEKPSELLNLSVVKDREKRCRTSICWVPELWKKDMPALKSSLRVLQTFDWVVTGIIDSAEAINEVTRGKCLYKAPGIDAIGLCPYSEPLPRSIDVLSIGRRASETHQALLQMARDSKLFYIYDTLSDLHTHSIREHRMLFKNLAKRSRYFIVNPGKIDVPGETGCQSEFGPRYFEGAAAGTILIGERPRNKEFDRIFHWPDAVIHLPYGSGDIAARIREVDSDPERQERIRRRNVVECLRHHDWAYRWEHILQLAGMEPLPMLEDRKRRLEALAGITEGDCIASGRLAG